MSAATTPMTKTAYVHLYDGRVELNFDYDGDVSPAIKIAERDNVLKILGNLTIRDDVNVKMINHRGPFRAVANGHMDKKVMRRIKEIYKHTKNL